MTHQANVRSDVQHDAVRVQLDTVLKVAIQSEYLHRHHPAVRSRPQPADRRLGFRFPVAAERHHPTGRERTASPTLQTLQDPILLLPGSAFQTLVGFAAESAGTAQSGAELPRGRGQVNLAFRGLERVA